MNKFTGYRCSLCGTEYLPGQVTYTCPKDGGNLDVILDYDYIKKKFHPEDITSRTESSLWRYLPLLPVNEPDGRFHSLARRRLDARVCSAATGRKTRPQASLAQG